MTQRTSGIAAAVVAAALSLPASAQPPASPAPSRPPSLAAGDVVSGFEAVGLDGLSHRVDFPKGSHTVVLFFLSSCPVCHKMLPLWSEYFQRKAKSLNVVAVMLDREPPGFFNAMPVAFPVLRSPGQALNQAFKVHHVPMTIRVGPGGKVEDAVEGLVDPIKLGEIFRP
jgi:thiol-disulfide isomerase/thioredoxin